MGQLEGKVAIVTGAASGIGLATAELFLSEGARVALVDKEQTSLGRLREALSSDRAIYLAADVSSAAETEHYVRAAASRFGRIDVAVLNVGIAGELTSIADSTVENFDRVIAVNVRGTWLGLHNVIPEMRKSGGGSIVITASTAGFRAGAPNRAPYVTSKHAVVGLMRSAAAECAPFGIRVNSVSPGGVDTPMTASIKEIFGEEKAAAIRAQFESTIPLKRLASPAEIAEAILFFASDRSRYCTATNLMVDGGLMG
jgi:NAD(P)-dependent dehydrogenase (short-subunit alcohol dehydrogenase family)